jgi:hypothetical protein
LLSGIKNAKNNVPASATPASSRNPALNPKALTTKPGRDVAQKGSKSERCLNNTLQKIEAPGAFR